MAIKRLQIPEGAPIWGPTKPQAVAVRLWKERVSDISVLSPGDYDVTPEPFRSKGPNSQLLSVMEDGTGLYRIFSVGKKAIKKINSDNIGGGIEQLPAGHGLLTHLPQDTLGRLIVGDRLERSNKGVLFLFDVIIWSPDEGISEGELASFDSRILSADLVGAGD